jgi:hypothetical protein
MSLMVNATVPVGKPTRKQELHFLNDILTRRKPGPAQLILVYGRRRIGKTVLLRHWAEQAQTLLAQEQAPGYTYWVAEKEPAAVAAAQIVCAPAQHPSQSLAAVCDMG